jgi:hypothetical protein
MKLMREKKLHNCTKQAIAHRRVLAAGRWLCVVVSCCFDSCCRVYRFYGSHNLLTGSKKVKSGSKNVSPDCKKVFSGSKKVKSGCEKILSGLKNAKSDCEKAKSGSKKIFSGTKKVKSGRRNVNYGA